MPPPSFLLHDERLPQNDRRGTALRANKEDGALVLAEAQPRDGPWLPPIDPPERGTQRSSDRRKAVPRSERPPQRPSFVQSTTTAAYPTAIT